MDRRKQVVVVITLLVESASLVADDRCQCLTVQVLVTALDMSEVTGAFQHAQGTARVAGCGTGQYAEYFVVDNDAAFAQSTLRVIQSASHHFDEFGFVKRSQHVDAGA